MSLYNIYLILGLLELEDIDYLPLAAAINQLYATFICCIEKGSSSADCGRLDQLIWLFDAYFMMYGMLFHLQCIKLLKP